MRKKETTLSRYIGKGKRHFREYKMQIGIASAAGFLIMCYLFGSVQYHFIKATGGKPKFPSVIYGLMTSWPYLVTFMVVCIYMIYVVSRPEVKKDRLGNYYYANSEVGGACHWMTDAEKDIKLNDEKYDDTVKDVLGYDIDDEGNMSDRILTAKQEVMFLNGHRCIIGGSGSRKTTTQLLNHALQAIRRGESIILTDPKGELYSLLKILCEQEGYDVKQFNVAHPGNSDGMDILKELLPISYSDTYETDINTTCQMLATSIMNNTSDPNSEGKGNFWFDTSLGVIQAELFKLANSSRDVTFKDFFADIQKDAVTFGKMFSDLPNSDPAKACMANFFDYMKSGKSDLCAQILGGVRTRLQVFNNAAYQNIVSNQEMDLVKPGFKKCAYFVIMSDQTHMMDFIAAMFFSLIFIRLVAAADARESQKLPVRVNFLMDEFYSSGKIEDFDNKLATVRSRNIGITMVLQNLGQLMIRYPNEHWEGIISNCDETVYIGGQDINSTAEYFAARMGTVTAMSESVGYHGFQQKMQRVSGSTSISEKEREVMTPAEIIQNLPLNYNIVLLKQSHPLLTGKVDYHQNPLSKRIVKFLSTWHIPEWLRKERGYPLDMPDETLHKLVMIANRHKFYGYYPLPGQQFDSFDDFLEAYKSKTLPPIPKDAKSAMSDVKLKSFSMTGEDEPSDFLDDFGDDVKKPEEKTPESETVDVPEAPKASPVPARRKTTKELEEDKKSTPPFKGAHHDDGTPDMDLPPLPKGRKRGSRQEGQEEENNGSSAPVKDENKPTANPAADTEPMKGASFVPPNEEKQEGKKNKGNIPGMNFAGSGRKKHEKPNIPVQAKPEEDKEESDGGMSSPYAPYMEDPEETNDYESSDDNGEDSGDGGENGSSRRNISTPPSGSQESHETSSNDPLEKKESVTGNGEAENTSEQKKPISQLDAIKKSLEGDKKKSSMLDPKTQQRRGSKQLGLGKNI